LEVGRLERLVLEWKSDPLFVKDAYLLWILNVGCSRQDPLLLDLSYDPTRLWSCGYLKNLSKHKLTLVIFLSLPSLI
jgi:hypothetical protein